MKSLLESAEDSASLATTDLLAIQALIDAYPIEMAELRASPKQLGFQKCFFNRADPSGRKCSIFVALGGNRSGKSYVAGWLCMAKYLRDHAVDGDTFWCVGQTNDRSKQGQQKELWLALPRWMFSALGEHQVWDEKRGFGDHPKLVLPTKDGGRCLVEFRSADQDPSTFEQSKLRGIWCDERLPETIYDRLLPRKIDMDGFLLYSDIPEQWWQSARLVDADPRAGVFFQHFEMHDNAHNLPPDAIDEAEAQMTEDQRKQRILGLFQIMEGVVYKEFIDTYEPLGHLIKPFRIPDYWPKWRAIDYGGSAPTACPWFAISPDEDIFIYREHYDRGQSVEINAGMIRAASGDEEYVSTLIDPHAIDPPPVYYGKSKTIAEQYADAGIETVGWPYINVLGEHATVQRVKFKLERRKLFVFDTCINTRREFKSWKYKTDKEGKPIAGDAFQKGDNHLLDCIKGWLATDPCFTADRFEII